MKSIIKLSGRLLSIAVFSVVLVACSEDIMDDINKDINHSKDAQAKYLLADVLTSTAFYNVGGDFNTYCSSYVEHEVGVHNQLYRAEYREGEPSVASTFNNVWGNCYEILKDAKIIISKCSEGGSQEGDDITKGIGEVMAAYNLALITDMYGDTPWKEACDYGTYMNPKIDKQEDIYKDVMAYLDAAIEDLRGSDSYSSGSVGACDFIYGGEASKWLKFAYGLKARYTMRLMHRSANVNTDMENIIEYVSKSFTSANEQAAFAIYDASNLNPLFDFQWSRDGLGASQSMASKLIERNDPRITRAFVYLTEKYELIQIIGPEDENYYVAPNGANEQAQYYYNTSIFVYSQTAPTLLLSYHEILFLKAEALCRLNRKAEAAKVLKDAVVAGIANMEVNVNAAFEAPTVGGIEETTLAITKADAEAYFDNEVKVLFDANPLKETMNQKYIAFFGASGESTECYNDIRRLKALGENWITLENKNPFPLRCPYGADDTTTNPNVKVAYGNGSYVFSEPVWWAGGTR
ncbi:hypothetical protein EZS27_002896 [termite gut metagenome]|uniref:SusD/RagB family nutrient-binding outer membrane lipoprotein n=1 Tax=termite gut metagenome TaxID=433724 RepID=A0A5J4SUR3_9ZZZZ